MDNSRSIKIEDAVSYGWKLVIGLFPYYLGLVVMMGIGALLLLISIDLNDGIVGIFSLPFFFIAGLGFTVIHIGIYYKIWTDIRNNSVNFVYTDTQEEYRRQNKEEKLRYQKKILEEKKKEEKKKEERRKQLNFKGMIIECENCSAKVRVKKHGKFRCPECKEIYHVDNDGKMSLVKNEEKEIEMEETKNKKSAKKVKS